MTVHNTLTGSELHGIVAATYADNAARDAVTYTAADDGKVYKVTADNAFYILSTDGTTNTWEQVNGGGAGIDFTGTNADEILVTNATNDGVESIDPASLGGGGGHWTSLTRIIDNTGINIVDGEFIPMFAIQNTAQDTLVEFECVVVIAITGNNGYTDYVANTSTQVFDNAGDTRQPFANEEFYNVLRQVNGYSSGAFLSRVDADNLNITVTNSGFCRMVASLRYRVLTGTAVVTEPAYTPNVESPPQI